MKKINIVFFVVFLSISLFSLTGPDEYFNKKIGEDRTLVHYNGIVKYMKYLGDNSDRVKTVNEGMTSKGNPMILSFISSAENMKNLDELVKINKKLANPDKMNKMEIDQCLSDGKVFILITGTIHSTEIASAQMMMLLAHKYAVSEDKEIKDLLKNIVIMLMPSINPDGNIMVSEWYEKYLGTEFEGGPLPYLYHHYAGHDTNRDFFMLNLKETRIVNSVLHRKYFPQVFLDMHQMGPIGPRMFVPPFKDPINENLDPLLLRETDIIGSFMALKLQEKGKKGVASGYAFDAYWPGGSKNTAWYKNVVGILTEMASVAIATPLYIDQNELRVASKGLPEYKKQVNFPDPWNGGWWRIGDIIDYEMIAAEALGEIVSKNRKSFLTNFLAGGKKSVRKGSEGPVFGYMINSFQHDRSAAASFLKRMAEGGVRIFRIKKDILKNNKVFSKGSFYIPLSQPYGNFVKVMMSRQVYPEIKHMRNGPIIEPYDSSGWTLPIQMGVKYEEVMFSPPGEDIEVVEEFLFGPGISSDSGNYYVLPASDNSSVIAVNRLLNKNIPVHRNLKEGDLKPGDYLIKKSDLGKTAIKDILDGTGVKAGIAEGSSVISTAELRLPRLAIYQSYLSSMDEGWTRWVLDNFEYKYTVVHNNDINNKNFPGKFDAVIFPDMNRDIIVNGIYRGYWGRYFEKLPPKYKGGIGVKGISNLKEFIKRGGTAIFLDSSYEVAKKDLNLPFINILEKTGRDKFYCPGSILKVSINTDDPIAWGMEEENILFFSHSPAFRTSIPMKGNIKRRVVSRFSNSGPHLVSGYLKGEKYLNRAVASMAFDYHKGNVIVFGGRIQHRAQTFATFKLLFNSIYYSSMKN
ncbi:MAG: M14 family zinc carboxypeptidase [Acidobacteriota bacterium]